MQEFFMDYGLWLLVGLLVIIGLTFLLSGKKKPDTDLPAEPASPPQPLMDVPPVAPAAPAAPAIADPVAPVAVPVTVTPVPQPDAAPVAEPAPEPTPAPAPAPKAVPAPVAAPAPDGDDLLKLKGVGPKLKALLIELGITRFAQIAAWSDTDIAAIDAKLGNFKGRPVRDHWVDQATYLAAGDIAGFEAKYGKL